MNALDSRAWLHIDMCTNYVQNVLCTVFYAYIGGNHCSEGHGKNQAVSFILYTKQNDG